MMDATTLAESLRSAISRAWSINSTTRSGGKCSSIACSICRLTATDEMRGLMWPVGRVPLTNLPSAPRNIPAFSVDAGSFTPTTSPSIVMLPPRNKLTAITHRAAIPHGQSFVPLPAMTNAVRPAANVQLVMVHAPAKPAPRTVFETPNVLFHGASSSRTYVLSGRHCTKSCRSCNNTAFGIF